MSIKDKVMEKLKSELKNLDEKKQEEVRAEVVLDKKAFGFFQEPGRMLYSVVEIHYNSDTGEGKIVDKYQEDSRMAGQDLFKIKASEIL